MANQRDNIDSSSEIYSLFDLKKGDFISKLWKVFIDDSADQHRRRFIVAGALFGTKGAWNIFNKEWRRTLRARPSIEYFHGKDLRRLEGPFAQFRDPSVWPKPSGSLAANAKRDALRQVIDNSSGLALFGVGVLVPEYEHVRGSHLRGVEFMAEDPFEYVLQLLIHRVAETIAGLETKTAVAFISDDSLKAEVYSKVYAAWKEKNPITAQAMLGIAHLDDKKIYGLQAADMAASVVKSSYEALEKGSGLQTGFPLEERFWKIEVHREENLLMMLDTQPAVPQVIGG